MKKGLFVVALVLCAVLCCSLIGCSKDTSVLDESMSKIEIKDALSNATNFTYENVFQDLGDYYKAIVYVEQHAYSESIYDGDKLVDFDAYFIEDNKLYVLSYSYNERYNTETTSVCYYDDTEEFLTDNYINMVSTELYKELIDAKSYQIKNNKLSFDADGESYLVRDINTSKMQIPSQLSDYKAKAVKGDD